MIRNGCTSMLSEFLESTWFSDLKISGCPVFFFLAHSFVLAALIDVFLGKQHQGAASRERDAKQADEQEVVRRREKQALQEVGYRAELKA